MDQSGIICIDTKMFSKKGMTALYLIGKHEIAIIETGTQSSAQKSWAELSSIPYFKPERVKYIVSTHIHLDHAGATGFFLKQCPNAIVLHHHFTKKHLIDPTRLFKSTMHTDTEMGEAYGHPLPVPENKIEELHSGDKFEVDDFVFDVRDSQGHHRSHYSFYERSTKTLFTGDSAGWFWMDVNAVIPTTAPPRFDYSQYLRTLQRHINLNPENLAFTHFGIHSTNTKDILQKSIDITKAWLNFVKEHKEDKTVEETTKLIIQNFHPEFLDKNLNQLELKVLFEIAIQGIFYYLDHIDIN